MKQFRYITFILSLMVIMGHDVVPHFHVDENDLLEHSATIPHQTNSGLKDIQNAFSHFQHSSAERNLVYLGAVEKKINPQIKALDYMPYLVSVEYSLIWYANYKKQRFWEINVTPDNYRLHSFSLRGPPTC
ncbi:hypothetical protein [Sediminibacterium soli]|uniref:hypothetical protein n=1 Tax=Sediminibacterium soli TaxID=2698829 RepID=UPI00137A3076|nr:hypothetical protein [Sediminibacterium soli]NCI46693.1 hypothetical protein [Sediminibacterium soli]